MTEKGVELVDWIFYSTSDRDAAGSKCVSAKKKISVQMCLPPAT